MGLLKRALIIYYIKFILIFFFSFFSLLILIFFIRIRLLLLYNDFEINEFDFIADIILFKFLIFKKRYFVIIINLIYKI